MADTGQVVAIAVPASACFATEAEREVAIDVLRSDIRLCEERGARLTAVALGRAVEILQAVPVRTPDALLWGLSADEAADVYRNNPATRPPEHRSASAASE